MGGFQNAFQKHTSSLSESGDVRLPRRHVFFTLDHEVCLPGVFTEDMTVELLSLTVAQEIRASRGSGMQGASVYEMTIQLAYESVYSIDGEVLNLGQKEWFWEAIGQAGRQLVVTQYRNLIGDSDEAQKKALESLRIEG